ncbi:hypothetical protein EJ05DRAFT_482214 [Pseudovirgaria hyperparasitica]|uniref:Uncharacterized protein n=1 Tax=Pseudovirgaria hyperparasitica TaxID=470096 RepID=A0A6A6WMN5_9PEZI|nr:uncharacterized protein EJ05DRAFT_482214 [Pseudovirgaria hyperparasitica]KAF2763408.1 hypothetical protein EJ05DRAFT_482214 [Pseudovirgaria hyperparasitica]
MPPTPPMLCLTAAATTANQRCTSVKFQLLFAECRTISGTTIIPEQSPRPSFPQGILYGQMTQICAFLATNLAAYQHVNPDPDALSLGMEILLEVELGSEKLRDVLAPT